MSSSRSSFFRQSVWMSFSTILGGAFMTAVHAVTGQMDTAEYEVFGAMLRLFLLLGIPSAGLQIAFAQQTAAALSPHLQHELATTTRRVLGAVVVLWLVMVFSAAVKFDAINARLKLGNGQVLWPTLGVGLLWLVIPVFRGILQGKEHFGTLGWVGILDGFLRFSGMVTAVLAFHTGAVGAMWVAFLAMATSTVLAAWSTRSVWTISGSHMRWAPWMAQVLPFTLGAGAMLGLANFDLLFLKAIIPADRANEFLLGERYQPAAMVGFAMTQITVPLALVMFPKIVRSSSGGGPTNALAMAVVGTALVGGLTVGFLTLFPKLPLQILYYRSPQRWAAAELVPWCAWAMLAYSMANVLVSNLLAQRRYTVVPWILSVAVLFVVTLLGLREYLLSLQPLRTYQCVAQILGGYNFLLLLIAWWLNRQPAGSTGATAPAPSRGA